MRRFRRHAILCSATAAAAVSALCALPRGIGLHDSGDLQMAAARFGIAHPPGYALLTLAGHAATRIMPVAPPDAVTLLNWLAGTATIALTIAWLRLLRVHSIVALPAGLALAALPRFWEFWTVAEVYIPGLLLLIAGIVAFERYEQSARAGRMAAAAAALSAAVTTRISLVPLLPIFVACVMIAARRSSRSARMRAPARHGPHAIAAIAGLLLPIALHLAYLWWRDTPATEYNYISQYLASDPVIAPDQFDPATKLRRIAWLASGRQYWHFVDVSPRAILGRGAAMVRVASPWAVGATILAIPLAVTGAMGLARRRPATTTLLVGAAIVEAAFLATFAVTDIASMTIPLSWIAITIAAIGLDRVRREARQHPNPARARPLRPVGTAAAAFASVVFLAICAARGWAGTPPADALIPRVEWHSLPPNALVLTVWEYYAPLVYERTYVAHRDDVLILAAQDEHLPAAARNRAQVFSADGRAAPGWTLEPACGIWRVRTAAEVRPTDSRRRAESRPTAPTPPRR